MRLSIGDTLSATNDIVEAEDIPKAFNPASQNFPGRQAKDLYKA